MRIVGNNPQLSRQTQATASGAITGGKPVVVNTDGTVTQISESTSAVGAEAVFESAVTQYIASTFDSSNNKVVIAYRDSGNSSYGTAIVIAPAGQSEDLTPAQTYFVQTDGTLSETADDPSVTAGTAVAGSTLIVKG